MLKRLAIIIVMVFIPALARADSVWTFDGELIDPGSWHAGFTTILTVTAIWMASWYSITILTCWLTVGPMALITLNQNNSTMMFENDPLTDPNISPNPPPLSTWLVSITGTDVFFHTNYDGPGQGATSLNNSIVDGELCGWDSQISGRCRRLDRSRFHAGAGLTSFAWRRSSRTGTGVFVAKASRLATAVFLEAASTTILGASRIALLHDCSRHLVRYR